MSPVSLVTPGHGSFRGRRPALRARVFVGAIAVVGLWSVQKGLEGGICISAVEPTYD